MKKSEIQQELIEKSEEAGGQFDHYDTLGMETLATLALDQNEKWDYLIALVQEDIEANGDSDINDLEITTFIQKDKLE